MSAKKIWGASFIFIAAGNIVILFWRLLFGLLSTAPADEYWFLNGIGNISLAMSIFPLITALVFGALGTFLIEYRRIPEYE